MIKFRNCNNYKITILEMIKQVHCNISKPLAFLQNKVTILKINTISLKLHRELITCIKQITRRDKLGTTLFNRKINISRKSKLMFWKQYPQYINSMLLMNRELRITTLNRTQRPKL